MFILGAVLVSMRLWLLIKVHNTSPRRIDLFEGRRPSNQSPVGLAILHVRLSNMIPTRHRYISNSIVCYCWGKTLNFVKVEISAEVPPSITIISDARMAENTTKTSTSAVMRPNDEEQKAMGGCNGEASSIRRSIMTTGCVYKAFDIDCSWSKVKKNSLMRPLTRRL